MPFFNCNHAGTMNKKTLALILTSLLFPQVCHPINSFGYVEIKEVKAWSSKIDVYLVDNQEHTCTNSSGTTNFHVDPNEQHMVSLVYMAFASNKKVSISYNCDTNGNPIVSGVRVR